MLERKWFGPFGVTVLIHLVILGLIATTFSFSRPSEPEYVEVTLAELFTPPESVDLPPDALQPSGGAPALSKTAPDKPAASQASVQPLTATGETSAGFTVSPSASTADGTGINAGASYGQGGTGGTGNGGTGQAGAGTGASGPPGHSGPPGPTRGPRVIASEKPEYPDTARQNGWEGTVRLRVLVSEEGTVQDVQVAASSGYRQLDQAAIYCIMYRWRFSPALEEGRPVTKWAVIPITFEMQ